MASRSARWVVPTYGAAALVFGGSLGGLAWQVRSGSDPALGAPVAAAQIPQPHYVVTRVVERRRVVIHRVRDLPPLPSSTRTTGAVATAGAPAAPAAVSAPAQVASSAPSAPAPAPVVQAPAPAAAAPVAAPVTRAS